MAFIGVVSMGLVKTAVFARSPGRFEFFPERGTFVPELFLCSQEDVFNSVVERCICVKFETRSVQSFSFFLPLALSCKASLGPSPCLSLGLLVWVFDPARALTNSDACSDCLSVIMSSNLIYFHALWKNSGWVDSFSFVSLLENLVSGCTPL